MNEAAQKATQPDPFQSYLTMLNVSRTSPRGFVEGLDLTALDNRIVSCGIGMPGIGKSACVYQCAVDRGVPFPVPGNEQGVSMVMHAPQLGVDDLYLPSIPDGGDARFFERRVPRTFAPILDYAITNREAILDGRLKPPLLLIEEPNRAREKSVIAALFTIVEDRRIGDLILPETIQIVCLMNPPVGGMGVIDFFKDSAARRRATPVGILPTLGEWLQHATSKKYNKTVVDFVASHPRYFYDTTGLLQGQMFACPASWQTVAILADRCEAKGLGLDSDMFLTFASGKVGLSAVAALQDFSRNRSVHVVPSDILTKYRELSEVRTRVKALVDEGRNDAIAELAVGVAATVFAAAPVDRTDPQLISKSLALFASDLPIDIVAQLMNRLTAEASSAQGGQGYLKTLSAYMSREPDFKAVHAKMAEARQREVAERMAPVKTEEDEESAVNPAAN